MALYQLNLAAGQVITVDRRKLWLRYLGIYLAIAILVMGVMVYWFTGAMVSLSEQKKTLDWDEALFVKAHPGTASMKDCLNQSANEVANLTAMLESIQTFQNNGQRSASLLLGLGGSLPPGMEVGDVSVSGPEGRLSVVVYMAASQRLDDGKALPSVISQWEKNPLLAGRVTHLTSENSEHRAFGGRDLLSWRFSGILEKGK